MTDEELALKQKLTDIKTCWTLIPDNTYQLSINNHTLLTQGDIFKILYKWQCPDISPDTFIVEYDNSYRLNVVKAETDYNSPSVRVARYLGCYVSFENDFPDFIVRPNSLADQLANLFFRNYVKVENPKSFNHKYVLESTDINSIEDLLGSALFELIQDTYEVHIEVRKNKCFIFFLEPAWANMSYGNMLQIAKELVIRNKAMR